MGKHAGLTLGDSEAEKDRLGNKARNLVELRHIKRNRGGHAAMPANELVEVLFPAARDDDLGALFNEASRQGSPDAGRGPEDEDF